VGSWMSLRVRVRVRVRAYAYACAYACACACMLMFTYLWAVVVTCLLHHSSAKSFLSARSNMLHLNRRVVGCVVPLQLHENHVPACAVLRNSADEQSSTNTRTSERTCAHIYTHTSQSV